MTAPQTTPPNEQRSRHPEWHNWRWQMQNRINTVEALRQYIDPTDDELEAIEVMRDVFRLNGIAFRSGHPMSRVDRCSGQEKPCSFRLLGQHSQILLFFLH